MVILKMIIMIVYHVIQMRERLLRIVDIKIVMIKYGQMKKNAMMAMMILEMVVLIVG